uniref:Uncharacterized protein n=1 Tax=Panagrolaimus sp. ES5 TaxID=591445 RepID=A0AC34G1N8_9BILA
MRKPYQRLRYLNRPRFNFTERLNEIPSPVLQPHVETTGGILPQQLGIFPQQLETTSGILQQQLGIFPQQLGIFPQQLGIFPQQLGIFQQQQSHEREIGI